MVDVLASLCIKRDSFIEGLKKRGTQQKKGLKKKGGLIYGRCTSLPLYKERLIHRGTQKKEGLKKKRGTQKKRAF
jgi:hypothetical protein